MLPNELSQESDLVAIDRLPAVAPRFRFRHNRRMPEMKAERKAFVSAFVSAVSTDFSPHRRSFCFRIARRQQQLCLMRLEHAGGLFAARPPHESPLRQPFLRQPEPLAVIDQDADRGPTPTPKYKQASGEGICLEFVLAQPGKRVDALPAIDRFDRYQDAHLRRDLDHADSHNARLSPARSGATTPFHWMRILPRGPSNSMMHSERPSVCGATNSKNSAGGAGARLAGASDSAMRFSLPYSRRRILAVRKTPCSRATAAADAHNASGIGKRPWWELRQRSKRR